jgi:hypothetical protein
MRAERVAYVLGLGVVRDVIVSRTEEGLPGSVTRFPRRNAGQPWRACFKRRRNDGVAELSPS